VAQNADGLYIPPAKPRRMSEKRYRDTYDTQPHTVWVREDGKPRTRYDVCGEVSGCVIANTYVRRGALVALQPSTTRAPSWW
jgi:hypothetical protein